MMNLERWKQVALERSDQERTGFLNHSCAGDDELRGEVEALLATHVEVGSFTKNSALEIRTQVLTREQIEPETPLVEGKTIGHYRILDRIGAGGMGEVYLAQDLKLGRKIALKLMPARFTADAERLRRFEQEAHTASALNHPNIVTIYEIGETNSGHFIATEFIDGETLRERMRSAPLKLGEVLDFAIQISSALSAAHAAGIVHRDIKPENIMLRKDGIVKILDFGLAKLTVRATFAAVDTEATTRAALITEPGILLGTASYMSPEQARGIRVDERTDIFSLGVVIYEMLARHLPFEGSNTYEILASILNDKDAPPLAQLAINVPVELNRIILKALRKDRGERYQTVGELLTGLTNFKHELEFKREVQRSLSPDANESGKDPAVIAAVDPSHTKGLAAKQRATITAIAKSILERHQRVLIVAAAATVIVLVTLVYFSYFRAPSSNIKTIDSIAVLPLVSASEDPDTDYLTDGITEDLINGLSQIQQLSVVARTTAFLYKKKEIDPRQVGHDLSVQAILMGKLNQRGSAFALQVELVDTSNGSQFWGKHYEGQMLDLRSVKQEIAREIAERLRPELRSDDKKRLIRGDTANTEAYNYYLRGRHFWSKRTADDLIKAIGEFQQAIDLDPNYALAYVGLADSYVLLEAYAGTPSSEVLPKARAAAERALQLDDSLAEAHVSLGTIQLFTWNFGEVERAYQRAIELNPNCTTAYFYYGFYLHEVKGKFDAAMTEIRRAQRLDPLSARISNEITGIHASKGELKAAEQAAKKVIELDPNFPGVHRMLGVVYLRQRRFDEAFAEFKKAVEVSGRGSWYLSGLGVYYAMAGDRAGTRAILKELEEKYERGEALGQHIADLYAALGDKDQAFAWLEKDFQAHSGGLAWIAYAPWSDTLRDTLSNDPRWNDLLRRIGLQN